MPPYTEPGSNPPVAVYHYWPQVNEATKPAVAELELTRSVEHQQYASNRTCDFRTRYRLEADALRWLFDGRTGMLAVWRSLRFGKAIQTALTKCTSLKRASQWLATSVSIAGGAEKAGAINLVKEPTYPTFPALSNMSRLPLRQYAGTEDSVAPLSNAQATQQELLRLGAKASVLFTIKTDHTGMQTAPFTADLLSWLLTHKEPYSSPCRPVLTNTPMTPLPRITKRATRHYGKGV